VDALNNNIHKAHPKDDNNDFIILTSKINNTMSFMESRWLIWKKMSYKIREMIIKQSIMCSWFIVLVLIFITRLTYSLQWTNEKMKKEPFSILFEALKGLMVMHQWWTLLWFLLKGILLILKMRYVLSSKNNI
jgi:EamA domain-containing membrane protein RarD